MALSLCKRSKSFRSHQRKDENKIFVFDTNYRVNGRSKRRNKVALDFFLIHLLGTRHDLL